MTNQMRLPPAKAGTSFVVENKSDDPLIVVSFLTGEKVIEPVKYYVISKEIEETVFKFWKRKKEVWAIETEFSVLSGFDSKEEACQMLYSIGEKPYFK